MTRETELLREAADTLRNCIERLESEGCKCPDERDFLAKIDAANVPAMLVATIVDGRVTVGACSPVGSIADGTHEFLLAASGRQDGAR